MSAKVSYRDLAHPCNQEALKSHNYTNLKLVKTVAEFAQELSSAHDQFSKHIQGIIEAFKLRNQELRNERPPDCPSTLYLAWETLLHEVAIDAQVHSDISALLIKNVCNPLLEISSYKKSQSKRLYAFREQFENIVNNSEESLVQCYKAYVEAYTKYKSNRNSRDSGQFLVAYHNAHNNYVLQLRSSNVVQEEFHNTALPYLLEELQEIHIDTGNTLNGAIESHALIMLTKANEQTQRYESVMKVCKQVNPKADVTSFVMAQTTESYEPLQHIFTPPTDTSIPGSEVSSLKNTVIFDRQTENTLNQHRAVMQKEAAELTSYLKQNQDITQTLMNICQRNLANHLYAKVYETQEDLCRKRNEIRVANLQLSAIRTQIDVLSPKQNGTLESDRESKKAQSASIKSMWKKAFKSLKTGGGEKGEPPEKQPEKEKEKKFSRLSSKRSLLRRKDSKDSNEDGNQQATDDVEEIDPVYNLLKCAAELPRQSRHGHACGYMNRNSPQGSDTITIRSSRSSSPSSATHSPRKKKKVPTATLR